MEQVELNGLHLIALMRGLPIRCQVHSKAVTSWWCLPKKAICEGGAWVFSAWVCLSTKGAQILYPPNRDREVPAAMVVQRTSKDWGTRPVGKHQLLKVARDTRSLLCQGLIGTGPSAAVSCSDFYFASLRVKVQVFSTLSPRPLTYSVHPSPRSPALDCGKKLATILGVSANLGRNFEGNLPQKLHAHFRK